MPITGLPSLDAIGDPERDQSFAARLNSFALPTERGWVVTSDAAGVSLRPHARGVAERYTVDAAQTCYTFTPTPNTITPVTECQPS